MCACFAMYVPIYFVSRYVILYVCFVLHVSNRSLFVVLCCMSLLVLVSWFRVAYIYLFVSYRVYLFFSVVCICVCCFTMRGKHYFALRLPIALASRYFPFTQQSRRALATSISTSQTSFNRSVNCDRSNALIGSQD